MIKIEIDKTEIESFKIWQPCLGQESKQSSSSRQIQQHGEGEAKEGYKVINVLQSSLP